MSSGKHFTPPWFVAAVWSDTLDIVHTRKCLMIRNETFSVHISRFRCMTFWIFMQKHEQNSKYATSSWWKKIENSFDFRFPMAATPTKKQNYFGTIKNIKIDHKNVTFYCVAAYLLRNDKTIWNMHKWHLFVAEWTLKCRSCLVHRKVLKQAN